MGKEIGHQQNECARNLLTFRDNNSSFRHSTKHDFIIFGKELKETCIMTGEPEIQFVFSLN